MLYMENTLENLLEETKQIREYGNVTNEKEEKLKDLSIELINTPIKGIDSELEPLLISSIIIYLVDLIIEEDYDPKTIDILIEILEENEKPEKIMNLERFNSE